MSHNWIFINSSAYRRFIERSRESRWVFWGATAGLFGAAFAAASVTMGLTNPDMEEQGAADRSDQVSKLPMHAQVRRAAAGCRAGPGAACTCSESGRADAPPPPPPAPPTPRPWPARTGST
jgi:hypothetical protein